MAGVKDILGTMLRLFGGSATLQGMLPAGALLTGAGRGLSGKGVFNAGTAKEIGLAHGVRGAVLGLGAAGTALAPLLAGAFAGGGAAAAGPAAGTFVGPGFGASAGSLFGASTPSVTAGVGTGAAAAAGGGIPLAQVADIAGSIGGQIAQRDEDRRNRLRELARGGGIGQHEPVIFSGQVPAPVDFRGLLGG